MDLHLMGEQVTFSENGTKITSKTQLRILHFTDNISKITMIQNMLCQQKCTISTLKGKNTFEIVLR